MANPADPVMEDEHVLEGGENDALLPGTCKLIDNYAFETMKLNLAQINTRCQSREEKAELTPHPAIPATNLTPTAESPRSVEDNEATTANTVPVPLEMLQKIVDFCAQTLRETAASKRILRDLERGQRNMAVRNQHRIQNNM
jgi:hypothetical protein